jgi:flagellar biosynthesis protein FlhG
MRSMRVFDFKLREGGGPRGAAPHRPVRTIAVTGGRVGLGKTTIAVNLALGLCREGGRAMLLDAGLGMANAGALLGLRVRLSLLDVLRGKQRLEDIIVDGPGNLKIVPGVSDIRHAAEMGRAECAGIVRAFSGLEDRIDTLIIDTASTESEGVASFCAASSDVVVIVTNEPDAVSDSITLIKLLHSNYAVGRFHILANRVQGAREGAALFTGMLDRLVERYEVALSYAGFIPYDDTLGQAASGHQAVIDAFPRSRSSMALKNLARRVEGWPRQRSPRGHLEFFIERLLQQDNVEMEVMS